MDRGSREHARQGRSVPTPPPQRREFGGGHDHEASKGLAGCAEGLCFILRTKSRHEWDTKGKRKSRLHFRAVLLTTEQRAD